MNPRKRDINRSAVDIVAADKHTIDAGIMPIGR
jgi:hypothetical protein